MDVTYRVTVPDALREEIAANFRKLQPIDHGSEQYHRKIAEEAVSLERCRQMVAEVERFCELRPGNRFLEVGSGYSCLVTILNRSGVDAYGLEPAFEEYASTQIAREILAANGVDPERVIDAPGENMPFPDDHFDNIYSMSVLEHTQAPEKVIDEVVRVLAPGGTAVLNFPNYGSWWEGHYNVVMLPHCPKWLFKLQVALAGRKTDYVDLLQFITYAQLRRWLKKHEGKVEVVSTGQEVWTERVRSLQFSEWGGLGKLRRIVGVVNRLGVANLVIALGLRLHWETPFLLVLRKPA
ncbi:MAG: class I SAM-dependent methyltransferase [Betaproteobacteria bacterium]